MKSRQLIKTLGLTMLFGAGAIFVGCGDANNDAATTPEVSEISLNLGGLRTGADYYEAYIAAAAAANNISQGTLHMVPPSTREEWVADQLLGKSKISSFDKDVAGSPRYGVDYCNAIASQVEQPRCLAQIHRGYTECLGDDAQDWESCMGPYTNFTVTRKLPVSTSSLATGQHYYDAFIDAAIEQNAVKGAEFMMSNLHRVNAVAEILLGRKAGSDFKEAIPASPSYGVDFCSAIIPLQPNIEVCLEDIFDAYVTCLSVENRTEGWGTCVTKHSHYVD